MEAQTAETYRGLPGGIVEVSGSRQPSAQQEQQLTGAQTTISTPRQCEATFALFAGELRYEVLNERR